MPRTLRPEEKIKYFYYVHGHTTILYLLEAVGIVCALWLLQ